jgi:uncharacterized protein (DUF433 family)
VARIEIGKSVVSDVRVCGGRLIFKHTRILVYDVVELAEKGFSANAISRQYRGLVKASAVREALFLIRRGVVREVHRRKAAS